VKAGLICNPAAGGGRGAEVGQAVTDALERRGLTVILENSRSAEEATNAARRLSADVDVVVAVGGDGTVNEVVNGLAGGGVPLGIVPAGTVNVLALELKIPFNVERACDVIVSGRTITMDLGRVDGRRFTLMAGAGLDALTIKELDLRAKQLFREAAFVVTGATALLRHPVPDFSVRVDGQAYTANFAVIGNSRYYGGRFGITSEADPADGLFDVLLFQDKAFGKYVLFWMGVPFGLHVRHPGSLYLKAKRVEMEPLHENDEIWYQTDGEVVGQLPAAAEIEEGALNVLVGGPHR
jgi:diacylglycerol kinase (ATP)